MKGKTKIRRVTFNEITKKAVVEAFKHARDVDENLVDAQQTRRVLDRIVGYQISPLLWDKVRRGLSAGRVQTVAVRLIVEREREIKAFNPVEYWTIDATADSRCRQGRILSRALSASTARRLKFRPLARRACRTRRQLMWCWQQLKKADWRVRSVENKERRKSAAASLYHQQAAAGCVAPAWVQRQAHHGCCAAFV